MLPIYIETGSYFFFEIVLDTLKAKVVGLSCKLQHIDFDDLCVANLTGYLGGPHLLLKV